MSSDRFTPASAEGARGDREAIVSRWIYVCMYVCKVKIMWGWVGIWRGNEMVKGICGMGIWSGCQRYCLRNTWIGMRSVCHWAKVMRIGMRSMRTAMCGRVCERWTNYVGKDIAIWEGQGDEEISCVLMELLSCVDCSNNYEWWIDLGCLNVYTIWVRI